MIALKQVSKRFVRPDGGVFTALSPSDLDIQAGEIFGLGMVVFGGYRILNALIAEAEKEEKACEKQPEEHR